MIYRHVTHWHKAHDAVHINTHTQPPPSSPPNNNRKTSNFDFSAPRWWWQCVVQQYCLSVCHMSLTHTQKHSTILGSQQCHLFAFSPIPHWCRFRYDSFRCHHITPSHWSFRIKIMNQAYHIKFVFRCVCVCVRCNCVCASFKMKKESETLAGLLVDHQCTQQRQQQWHSGTILVDVIPLWTNGVE